jgi:hypothetical protein
VTCVLHKKICEIDVYFAGDVSDNSSNNESRVNEKKQPRIQNPFDIIFRKKQIQFSKIHTVYEDDIYIENKISLSRIWHNWQHVFQTTNMNDLHFNVRIQVYKPLFDRFRPQNYFTLPN